jgi:hypothetical protein
LPGVRAASSNFAASAASSAPPVVAETRFTSSPYSELKASRASSADAEDAAKRTAATAPSLVASVIVVPVKVKPSTRQGGFYPF